MSEVFMEQKKSSKNFTVVFEHIGEGYNGEYNHKDSSDKPLMRCDIFRNDEMDEPIRNGSFCTNIEDKVDVSVLLDTMLNHLEELFIQYGDENIGTISRLMGLYSWYDAKSDFTKRVEI